MDTYAFDVTVSTNDLLKQGVTEARLVVVAGTHRGHLVTVEGCARRRTIIEESPHTHHRVLVSAESRDEAALAAAQMAASIPGAMVTGVYDRV